jgi:predicted DNA-binding protein
MQQFTKTIRLRITPEMGQSLKALKRVGINPTKFMRISIQKELDKICPQKGLRYEYILI